MQDLNNFTANSVRMLSFNDIHSRKYTVSIHILIWVSFFFVPLLFIESGQGRARFIVLSWFMLLLMAGYFYLNYLYLIPRYLLRRKTLQYFLLLLISLVIIGFIHLAYIYSVGSLFEHRHRPPFYHIALMPLYPAILAFALSTAIRITSEWFKTEKQKKEMEAEKLFSELAFLKSQVNPHFLFNILNNICSLARKKSDDTENAIIKLAQIMRYMLQDSKDEKVSLEKEVEYLHNYIELQRLRISDHVRIQFTLEGQTEVIMLEPLLLIPFIENAFKHGVSYLENSAIDIFLRVDHHSLFLRVNNKVVRKDQEVSLQGSGIGLKNVIRRLDLLYPEKHRLVIHDDGEAYQVELTIHFLP